MSDSVPTKIYEILKKVVNGDIDKFTITVNDPNKKGEGYLGQMFFISLLEKDNGKQFHFAIKQAFSDTSIRNFHPIRDVFLSEINFYRNVWPRLSRFQEQIPKEYRFLNLAKCFGALSEENYERLVFENLKYNGFVMHDKKKPLDMEHFESIFKIYGKLHAVSFALKSLNPQEFSEISKSLFNVWDTFTQRQPFKDAFKMTHESCLEAFQPGVDDAIIEKYRHYVEDAIKLFRQCIVPGKYATIIHGDCWSNNMMFKYDDAGKLTDLKFLDFQLVMLGSPVCDLSYCLYSGGTKEVFDKLDNLLHVYYGSLSDSLRQYGCNPDDIYPFQELKNEWKFYSQLGFIMSVGIWRGKMIYDDDVLDLTDLTEEDEGNVKKFFETNFDKEMYNKIVRDIITHFYENDFLY